jgi:hypothetical protein
VARPGEGEVELVRVSGTMAAEPILAALRANGIPARAAGEAVGSVYGLTLDGLGEVVIFVPREVEEAARALLAAAERHELELAEEGVEPVPAPVAPASSSEEP